MCKVSSGSGRCVPECQSAGSGEKERWKVRTTKQVREGKVEVRELPIIRQGKQAGEGERFVLSLVVIPPSRFAVARVPLHPVESSNTVRLGLSGKKTAGNRWIRRKIAAMRKKE